MSGFRGSRAWDFRVNPAREMCFSACSLDQARADVRTRALTALRHCIEGEAVDIEGPLWALADLYSENDRVIAAGQWFRVAAAYSDDDELRRVKCQEAYGLIESALRRYL